MYLRDEDSFPAKLEACLKKMRTLYPIFRKALFMDISVGIVKFTCQMGLEVSGVIAEADHFLYAAKRGRTDKGLRLRQSDAPRRMMETPEADASFYFIRLSVFFRFFTHRHHSRRRASGTENACDEPFLCVSVLEYHETAYA